MNQKTKQALYIILTALLFAAILLVLLPFLFIWLIFTTHPISFLIASIFIIGEIIFGFIKVVQYITNKSQKTPSKFKTIFRRTWLAVGIGAILAQPLLYGMDLYYEKLEDEYKETYTEAEFDEKLYRAYKPFDSNKIIRLPEKTSLQFSEENQLPKIDGAKALYPVYASFAENIYPKNKIADEDCFNHYLNKHGRNANPQYKQSIFVNCNNTIQSFENLLHGEIDIAFLAKPSKNQMQMAEENGIQLNMKPIGKEAFVFFTNKKNTVNNLSQQNIKDIYSGKIKYWHKVGGKFQKIRPFQRNENSGSQSTMQKLMGDTPLMQPEKRNYSGSMGGMIRRVAKYRNHANAMGYSFRFFVETLHANENIKLFSIDGVYPSKDNIRNGTYPFAYPFYAITVKGRESPETQQFLQWLDSPDAKYIIENAGYTAID